jgi:hypothetical protein
MPLSNYSNFGGGLNDKTLGGFVMDNEEALMYAETGSNMYMGTDGLKKVHGFSRVTETPRLNPQGIFEFKGELLACWEGKVFRVNNDNSLTLLHEGLDATAPMYATEWVNRCVITNGINKPVVYNGTTVTEMPVVEDSSEMWNDARPKAVAVFRNRAFYWGDPQRPDTLYTPRPETLANFDAGDGTADFFDVAPGHGGKITGVVPLTDDFLVIYKERAIYSLRGNAPVGAGGGEPFRLNLITSDVGCVATRTIVAVGMEHYFLSQVGLRKLSTTDKFGAVEADQPHYKISGLIETLAFDEPSIQNAVAAYVYADNSIYLGIPQKGDSTNGLVLVYHIITGANTLRQGWVPQSLGVFKRTLYHQAVGGHLYRHDPTVYTHDAAGYLAEWESKWIAHGGIMPLKRYRGVYITVDAGPGVVLTARWYLLSTDRVANVTAESLALNGGALWDTAIWDVDKWGDGGQQVFPIRNLGKGHALKLGLSTNMNSQDVSIRQIDVEYDILSTRRG